MIFTDAPSEHQIASESLYISGSWSKGALGWKRDTFGPAGESNNDTDESEMERHVAICHGDNLNAAAQSRAAVA